jgi:hypothetical protein
MSVLSLIHQVTGYHGTPKDWTEQRIHYHLTEVKFFVTRKHGYKRASCKHCVKA